MTTEVAKQIVCWTLQGRPDLTGPVEVINVQDSTIRVGRCGDVTLRINRPTISSCHAEVFELDKYGHSKGQAWIVGQFVAIAFGLIIRHGPTGIFQMLGQLFKVVFLGKAGQVNKDIKYPIAVHRRALRVCNSGKLSNC